jgi:PAS domain-containing protein
MPMPKAEYEDDFRRNLHRQLQRSTLIDRAIDNCPVLIWATDKDGEVLLCDGGAMRVLGFTSDIIGHNVASGFPYPTRWNDAYESVSSSAGVTFTISTDHGYIVESFAPLLSPAGRVVGVLVVSMMVGVKCPS